MYSVRWDTRTRLFLFGIAAFFWCFFQEGVFVIPAAVSSVRGELLFFRGAANRRALCVCVRRLSVKWGTVKRSAHREHMRKSVCVAVGLNGLVSQLFLLFQAVEGLICKANNNPREHFLKLNFQNEAIRHIPRNRGIKVGQSQHGSTQKEEITPHTHVHVCRFGHKRGEERWKHKNQIENELSV